MKGIKVTHGTYLLYIRKIGRKNRCVISILFVFVFEIFGESPPLFDYPFAGSGNAVICDQREIRGIRFHRDPFFIAGMVILVAKFDLKNQIPFWRTKDKIGSSIACI